MADRTFEQAQHFATVAEAKDHLGMVPTHLRAGLALYFDSGVQPGRFLCAVLENDLAGATLRCSDEIDSLFALASFLYNFAPSSSHGSKEARIAWQERVSALFARAEEETRDTDPAPPGDDAVVPDLLPPPGVVFAPDDDRRFDAPGGPTP